MNKNEIFFGPFKGFSREHGLNEYLYTNAAYLILCR
jgi:hypothetical protein